MTESPPVEKTPFSASPHIERDSLTACQDEALRTLDAMIVGDARIGVLKGYAGTGKTFLSTLIIRHLTQCGWTVKVMTPTGRAAKVLGTILKNQGVNLEPRTIHSTIYSILPQDYSKGQMSLFADTQAGEFFGPTFFIVDESSMVGNVRSERKEEGLHFGSGSLLHDVLEHVDLAHHTDNRVLFVGDPGQLPPVMGGTASPALNPFDIPLALPEGTPPVTIVESELRSIVRQKEGSLREFVTDLRTAMHNGDSLPKDARQDVQALPPDHLTEHYLELTAQGRHPEAAMILAHRNADVIHYNLTVRSVLFPEAIEPVVEGDILLVRRNVRMTDNGELDISSSQEDLKNGTFVRVQSPPMPLPPRTVSLKGGKDKVTLRYAQCTVQFTSRPDAEPIEVVLLTNMLDRDYWMDYKKNYHLLEVGVLTDFKNRMMDEYGWAPPKPDDAHYVEYSRQAKSDKLLNALRVSYGYSVTVHSAQGGEWDHVIVDPQNPARDWLSERHQSEYKRWVYTSATRAKKKLWFIKRPAVPTVDGTELGLEQDA